MKIEKGEETIVSEVRHAVHRSTVCTHHSRVMRRVSPSPTKPTNRDSHSGPDCNRSALTFSPILFLGSSTILLTFHCGLENAASPHGTTSPILSLKGDPT